MGTLHEWHLIVEYAIIINDKVVMENENRLSFCFCFFYPHTYFVYCTL